jgi:hypothetical protein
MSILSTLLNFWRRPAIQHATAFLLLALLILGVHHSALVGGLFMDDYAHFQQLKGSDWSLAGLTDACRLELIGGVAEIWFLPECTLRFFRPLAFGLMKLTYTLAGWDPFAMHAASLAWHLLTCTLLAVLLRRLGAAPWLSWGVAGLFAIHPGQITPVQWLACQTELMVTSFLLAATLCYLRFRGWSEPDDVFLRRPRPPYAWALVALLFFAAALGCRENAIAFPFVMLPLEFLLRKRFSRHVVLFYAAAGLIVVAYLWLRSAALAGMSLPPYPYVYHPGDPGFLRFIFDKTLYYLLGEFLLAPIVPFGGVPYLRARPFLFYSLAALVLILLLAVSVRFFRRRPGLLAPAWLLGFMAPVLPAFSSPHHLYLPGIGWAIIVMLLLRGIGGHPATSRPRQALMWLCIISLGAGFSGATLAFGVAFDTAQRVEDQVATEIISVADQLQHGDTLYIANLPMIAHYTQLSVEHQTGLRNLKVRPLTWAPRVLGLVGTGIETEITWVDERTIIIRVVGDRYFSGPMGRLVAQASGNPTPQHSAEWAAQHGFTAEVIEADADGVAAIRFTFERPLTDPGIHLFWGSRVRWAMKLNPAAEHE